MSNQNDLFKFNFWGLIHGRLQLFIICLNYNLVHIENFICVPENHVKKQHFTIKMRAKNVCNNISVKIGSLFRS